MIRRALQVLSLFVTLGLVAVVGPGPASAGGGAGPGRDGSKPVPAITSPAPGSTLRTNVVTFRWQPGADRYRLRITSGERGDRYEVYDASFAGSVTEARVTGLPLHGKSIRVELTSRFGRRQVQSTASFTAGVRRGLAVIVDFENARLEDWQEPPGWSRPPGFHNEAEIRATLDDMTAHWAWLSRGREVVRWDLTRVRLARPLMADPPDYGLREYRIDVMKAVAEAGQVDLSSYDVDADGITDSVWMISSDQGVDSGGPGYEYLGGGSVQVNKVKSFVDSQASYAVAYRRYGAFNHEFAHNIALPDLYGPNSTVERLSLMGVTPEDVPGADLSAYDRERLGWLEPRVVERSTRRIQLRSANDELAAVRIPAGWDGEYFLIEYRKAPASGYGSVGPRFDGLAVYHVWAGQSQNTVPQIVTLEAADGVVSPGPGGTPEPTDLFYPGNPTMDLSRWMRSYRDGDPVFRLTGVHRTRGGMSFGVEIDRAAGIDHPEQIPLVNASMEAGAGTPDGWDTLVDGGPVAMGRSTAEAHSGGASAEINASGFAFAQWTQTVTGLDPGRDYLLCAWIKGRDITTDENGDVGAGLLVSGTSDRLSLGGGTFDWTHACMMVEPPAGGSLTLACALGGWGSRGRGTMWCDDVELTLPQRST